MFSAAQQREYSSHVLRRCALVAQRVLADQLAEVGLHSSAIGSLFRTVQCGFVLLYRTL